MNRKIEIKRPFNVALTTNEFGNTCVDLLGHLQTPSKTQFLQKKVAIIIGSTKKSRYKCNFQNNFIILTRTTTRPFHQG